MTGRRIPATVRLATARQLWVLNRAGRLALPPHDADELEPISNAEADAAIRRSMGLLVDAPVDEGGGEAGKARG